MFPLRKSPNKWKPYSSKHVEDLSGRRFYSFLREELQRKVSGPESPSLASPFKAESIIKLECSKFLGLKLFLFIDFFWGGLETIYIPV